jgi:nicotinate-nucleotide adenylyltransferase
MTVKPSIKVGLLGGTFNPIHKGHIELGLIIREAFELDKVFYILAARPPHKKAGGIIPADLRWEMLTRVLEHFPRLEPCDIEMKRPLDSWTVDTVEELYKINPGNIFYFISGSEGFLKIRTWKNYKKLLNRIPFIVVLRKEDHREQVERLVKGEGITPYLCNDKTKPGNTQTDTHMPCVYIYSYQSDKLRISSTLIRQKVKLSECIDDFVNKEVKNFMEEYKLYEK